MFCFRYIVVNTMHKGDKKYYDDDDDDDNPKAAVGKQNPLFLIQ